MRLVLDILSSRILKSITVNRFSRWVVNLMKDPDDRYIELEQKLYFDN
jgi:hypothetical protein